MSAIAVTVIYMGAFGPLAPCVGIHGHHCPCCFEVKLCTEACTREPDLEDPREGIQMGAHARCDECERAGRPLP